MTTLRNLVLWFALAASLVVYVGVAYFSPVAPSGNAPPLEVLLPAFGALSAAIAVGTIAYRRIALVRPIQEGVLDLNTSEGQEKGFQVLLVLWVFSESIGIYGLVLSFLSGVTIFSALFSAAALALLFIHRPTASTLQPPLTAQGRGHDPTPIV